MGKEKHLLTVIVLVLAILTAIPVMADNANLVSNVEGKIRVIILHYGNGDYFGGGWFDHTVMYRELMDKMDDDVAFVVLLGTDLGTDRVKKVMKPYTEQKLPDGTARLKYLNVKVKTSMFYPWARDGYLILSDKNNRLIFQDVGFNYDPFPILNWGDVFDNCEARASFVHRGGGNIRTTENEVFIGMDTFLGIGIKKSWSLFVETDETLYSLARDVNEKNIEQFKKQFDAYVRHIHQYLAPDKKLVIPGKEMFFKDLKEKKFKFTKKKVWHTGAQAAYHTDVYLSLGHVDENGKRVLFVADSRAGAEIVKKMTDEERRAVERHMPEVLESEGLHVFGFRVTARQLAERYRWDEHKMLDLGIKISEKLADKLDKFTAHLEEQGFRVVRIPYFANGLKDTEKNRFDRMQGISFNYSNVLTEVFDGKKRVYLPEFGFKQMDEAAAAAYRKAGFETIPINGLVTNGMTGGSAGAGLDCLTSDIRIPVKWTK